MPKETRQSLIAYLITVIVAFTVGLYFGVFSNPFVLAAPKDDTHALATKQWAQTETLFTIPLPYAVPLSLYSYTAPVKEKKPPATKPADPSEFTEAKQDVLSSPIVHIYETTAYYLNVRVHAYNQSEIISTVEKGTILEVSSVTENGWLRLQGGGYVHGGYAKPIKGELKRTGPQQKSAKEVKSLSADTEVNEISTPTSEVESISGLTAQHIALILKGTDLEDQGLEKAILRVEKKYGINAFFTIAVMKLESGNGSSRLATKKNNLFGLNAIDGDAFNRGLSFKTKADCVLKFGELIANKYIEKGYTTVDKVAKKYCPANSRWPRHVKEIMKSDLELL
ncbi:glucosaminidase domain-containing protein [Paenibacillus kobensis]|uniref:glucosaminidase domain-containing protein n=1 Tax=Paenibacillus kobensis TaxID=59841 RepID=UPI000FD752FA|nr:glucosaminidase domain-containing protein [Paenibacillus kobensis]